MEQLRATDPQRIGGYRLLARLGAGGMGEVYLARSDRGRTVAVKLIRQELAEQEEFRSRFRREVNAAGRVGGQWTAPVLDADTEAAVPWVATGYIAGPSLHEVVARTHGPLSESSARVLAGGLAYALKDIHAAGLIHRDLKPSNVLVTIDGPRVIDFGIARALQTVADADLTRTGAVVGSPGFMAPEQVRGERITTACDVFCLGSVLAFAATGKLPFGNPDSGIHALMYRIAEEEPDLSELPGSLAELVADCLRKDPAARPTTEEILDRTGAADALRDGSVRDPWLPSSLLAGLARHAVGLLDHEHAADPEPADGPAGGVDGSVPDAQGTAVPQAPLAGPEPNTPPPPSAPPHQSEPPATPTGTPGQGSPPLPAPVAGYGYPQHPGYGTTPPYGPSSPYAPSQPAPYVVGHATAPTSPAQPQQSRRERTPHALLALLVVLALVTGGAVYAVMNGGRLAPESGPEGGSSADPDKSPPGGDDTPAQPANTPDVESDEGQVPQEFIGTWRASFEAAEGGTNTRVLTIRQGKVGETVMTLTGRGPGHDCRWTATLKASGPPLELNTSDVTQGSRAACSPGEWSRLSLATPNSLVRELVGSDGTPLTYTKSN